MKNQTSNELLIFQKFASVAPMEIDQKTIQNREPPEPDIFCQLKNDGKLRFELTEALDGSIAQSLYGSLELNNLIRKKFEGLPESSKERFSNAVIRINYLTSLSLNRKKSLLTAVISYLENLPKQAVGEFTPQIDGVESVEIKRGGFVGPSFEFNTIASFFDNPVINRLNEKFSKKYSCEEIIDLIVYFDLQPELPESTWLPEAMEYVRTNINSSSFNKVWFFSVTETKIIAIHP